MLTEQGAGHVDSAGRGGRTGDVGRGGKNMVAGEDGAWWQVRAGHGGS
jgi:hypothetical protein